MIMDEKDHILEKLTQLVQARLSQDSTGHDWEHTKRVCLWADKIAQSEKDVDFFILKVCALLHDVADHKFVPDAKNRAQILTAILLEVGISDKYVNEIIGIIESISFKGGKNTAKSSTIESKIIQDADRLDSIGAIGIARTFAYGGAMGRAIFSPDDTKQEKEASIEHFYSKLLKLASIMNTQAGKEVATVRHEFLKLYLKEFFTEWFGQEEGLMYFENKKELS